MSTAITSAFTLALRQPLQDRAVGTGIAAAGLRQVLQRVAHFSQLGDALVQILYMRQCNRLHIRAGAMRIIP
ncbi:hypothetical protein D3C77_785830 [compost metagenome]